MKVGNFPSKGAFRRAMTIEQLRADFLFHNITAQEIKSAWLKAVLKEMAIVKPMFPGSKRPVITVNDYVNISTAFNQALYGLGTTNPYLTDPVDGTYLKKVKRDCYSIVYPKTNEQPVEPVTSPDPVSPTVTAVTDYAKIMDMITRIENITSAILTDNATHELILSKLNAAFNSLFKDVIKEGLNDSEIPDELIDVVFKKQSVTVSDIIDL